jgi:hypothetical protein
MSIDRTRGVDQLLLVGLEAVCEFDGLAVFGGTASRGWGLRLCWLLGHRVLRGPWHAVEGRGFAPKRPQRCGESTDRGDSDKGVEHEESRGGMAYSKLQGPVDPPHSEGVPLCLACIVSAPVGKASNGGVVMVGAPYRQRARGQSPEASGPSRGRQKACASAPTRSPTMPQ